MITAYQVAIIAAGLFFFNALLTGVWQYVEIASSEDSRAHPYVGTAHRASLMYSFAALLIATFVQISELPDPIEFIATLLLLTYFLLAILGYMTQGFLKKTDNQFRDAHPSVGWFMGSLIFAEISSFAVLFYGVLAAIL